MAASTPEKESFIDEFEGDVSLGAGSAPLPRTTANYSTTDEVPGVLIYTHGCSVRVGFNLDTVAVLEALGRCGWSKEAPAKTWKTSKPGATATRYVMRGSRWLEERPPGNRKLPLVGKNREWTTRIYSLAIEIRGVQVHVDLQVIRHGDIGRFMEDVLGLKPSDYQIAYYRTVERFFVLPPHEAFMFGQKLHATPSSGKGRLTRKKYLVRDLAIPLQVRKRAKATATIVVYRIDRGATASFKVELRLRGQRHDRGQFHEADIGKLDAILLGFVTKYDLHPIPKPARWEPRSFATTAEDGAFDLNMKKVPQRAWRGAKIPRSLKQLVEKCHTPTTVKLVACTRHSGAFPPSAHIRSDVPSSPRFSKVKKGKTSNWKRMDGKGFEVTHYLLVNQQQGDAPYVPAARGPWNSIVQDISRSRLYLHEVVLDPQDDPAPLLHAVAGGVLGRVGVAAICAVDPNGHADTWQSVIEAARKYPYEDPDIATFVIVIDPSAAQDVAAAVVGNMEPTITDDGEMNFDRMFEPGPLMPPETHASGADALPMLFKATGAWLFDLFEQLRRLGEETGIRYIIVTCDGRPDHGKGPIKLSHYFRDARVRSSIGDAGRYHAHQRYLVERLVKTTFTDGYTETVHDGDDTIGIEHLPQVEEVLVVGNVVVVKDEAVGLPGRLVYEAPIQPDRPRWNRKKPL